MSFKDHEFGWRGDSEFPVRRSGVVHRMNLTGRLSVFVKKNAECRNGVGTQQVTVIVMTSGYAGGHDFVNGSRKHPS